MRKKTRTVWKKRTHEEQTKHKNDEFRSYFVSYVDGEAIYNVKHGDTVRQIPPVNVALDQVISLSRGYSVGQSSTVDSEQPQLEPHILENQLSNQFYELSHMNRSINTVSISKDIKRSRQKQNIDKNIFSESISEQPSQIENIENSPLESQIQEFYILVPSNDEEFIQSQFSAQERFKISVIKNDVDESVALYKRLKELNILEGTLDNPSSGNKHLVQSMIEAKSIVRRSKSFKHFDKTLWDLPEHLSSTGTKRIHKFSSSMGIREPVYVPLIDGGYTMFGSYRIANPVRAQIDQDLLLSHLDSFSLDFQHSMLPSQISKRTQLKNLVESDMASKKDIVNFVKAFGIPKEHRSFIWQLVTGCISESIEDRNDLLAKKRRMYYDLIDQKMDLTKMVDNSIADFNIILLDTPRTSPSGFNNLFLLPCVRQSLERVLLLWSLTNSSGYFQGLNDIAATIYTVFLDTCLNQFGDINETFTDPEGENIKYLEDALMCCESDVYYCLTSIMKNLESIHPFKRGGLYTESMVEMIENLVKKHDYKLWLSITNANIPFLQFLFRWLLCFFIREMSLQSVVCLWDSYFIEESGFPIFHVYVASAYLFHFSQDLVNKEFEEMLTFLFHMPTGHYTKHDVHNIVQSAYELQLMYPYPMTE